MWPINWLIKDGRVKMSFPDRFIYKQEVGRTNMIEWRQGMTIVEKFLISQETFANFLNWSCLWIKSVSR